MISVKSIFWLIYWQFWKSECIDEYKDELTNCGDHRSNKVEGPWEIPAGPKFVHTDPSRKGLLILL